MNGYAQKPPKTRFYMANNYIIDMQTGLAVTRARGSVTAAATISQLDALWNLGLIPDAETSQ